MNGQPKRVGIKNLGSARENGQRLWSFLLRGFLFLKLNRAFIGRAGRLGLD